MFRALALLLVLPFTGCGMHKESFTYKLWHGDEFGHFREPATNAQITVYYCAAREDYLVTYTSLRDGDSSPRRKAFFFGAYERSLLDHQKPQSVSTNRLELAPVPVNGATNVLPRATFNGRLTIYTPEGQIGPYQLPVFAETKGVAVRAALSPLTAASDVTCLSLIAGFFAALVYAGGGPSVSPH